jgi:hypothetical protein
VNLPPWLNKLLGRRKAQEPSAPADVSPPSDPSMRPLTEEEQAERDKADKPPESPGPSDYLNP